MLLTFFYEHGNTAFSVPSQLFPQVKIDYHANLKGCKERCEDSEWCFKQRLCSAQQGLNGGERSPIMQLDWPSLIRIISAQCFTTASYPLNAKCFRQPGPALAPTASKPLQLCYTVSCSKQLCFCCCCLVGGVNKERELSRLFKIHPLICYLWQEGVTSH